MNESEKLRKISVLNDQEMKKPTAMYASGSGSGSISECDYLIEKFGTEWQTKTNTQENDKTLKCWDDSYVSCPSYYNSIEKVYYASDYYVYSTIEYATCTSGTNIKCPNKPICPIV